ncbi:MAG: hypothetical protein FWD70_01895 [Desulfuromonadales bacterium]|nr:hypothetical protein [Desulfuromonadales bacterium]
MVLISIILAMFLSGCEKSPDDTPSKKTKIEDCIEPYNPYNDGGGHYAGFNWAAENAGDDCDGNSDEFNEGCAEFHRQLDEYDECVANSSK